MRTTEEQFLKDVSGHVMEVILDNGLYRHIRFKNPSTGCMHFDLITWPGRLCYTGDMGTYVFKRLPDMFEFFRTARQHASRPGLSINPRYWSEKLEAVDGTREHGAVIEFSPDKFRRIIKEELVEWWREAALTREQRHDLRTAVEQDVLIYADDGQERALDAADLFQATVGGQKFRFYDIGDHDFSEYTPRFIWCCYALAWGIQIYDEASALKEAA